MPEVKEIRCYSKEKNKFMNFNEGIVTERFLKVNGFEIVPELQDVSHETILVSGVSTNTTDVKVPESNPVKAKRKYTKKKK